MTVKKSMNHCDECNVEFKVGDKYVANDFFQRMCMKCYEIKK